MIKSFIELVKESQDNQKLVDEMGLKKVERLPQSEMGRIRRETLAKRERDANYTGPTYLDIAKQLMQKLKDVNRNDITMEVNRSARYYYPKFPRDIVELMEKLKELNKDRFEVEFGKWRDVYPNDSSAIYFKTDSEDSHQRSHFPQGGITHFLRGTGLGYKLYRTLLKYAKYISSNTSGTKEKDKAWGSLLSYKSNPDGSPSNDDAHAIVGKSNWLAMDKEPERSFKVRVASDFIRNVIGFNSTQPDRFDMDDELIDLLPVEILVQLRPEYLDSLLRDQRLSEEKFNEIDSRRSNAERFERETQERRERKEQERRAREEATIRERLASRLAQYGAKPDESWGIGDFIVVKSYLYDQSYSSLPIRQVVRNDGPDWTAVGIDQAIELVNGQIRIDQLTDTRTTSQQSSWVKVDPSAIPDLTRVNLSPSGIEYINSIIRETPSSQQTDTQTSVRVKPSRQEPVSQDRIETDVVNAEPTRSEASELRDLISLRNSNRSISNYLKNFKRREFTNFVLMPMSRLADLRESNGIPVLIPFYENGTNPMPLNSYDEIARSDVKFMDMLTGEPIQKRNYDRGPICAFDLSPVTEADKLSARAGDHFYIASHQNAYGLIGKCDYTTRNTINQPFIYLRIYGSARPIPVRLDLLRKLDDRVDNIRYRL